MRRKGLWIAAACAALALGATACGQKQEAETTAVQETAAEETTAEVVETGEIESLEETQAQAAQMVRIYGPVTRMEDGRLSMDNQSGQGYSGEIILNIPEGTLVLNAEDGLPADLDAVEDGTALYAYIGPAMTMSLPPMTNAELILCNIPADYKVPDYVEVKSVVTDASSSKTVLTGADGTEFEISEDCQFTPYLTRNIVTVDDLTEGVKCLVWSGEDNAASRIMIFPQQIEAEDIADAE